MSAPTHINLGPKLIEKMLSEELLVVMVERKENMEINTTELCN